MKVKYNKKNPLSFRVPFAAVQEDEITKIEQILVVNRDQVLIFRLSLSSGAERELWKQETM